MNQDVCIPPAQRGGHEEHEGEVDSRQELFGGVADRGADL